MYVNTKHIDLNIKNHSKINLFYINNYNIFIYIFISTFIFSYVPRLFVSNFINLDIQAAILSVPIIIFILINLKKNIKIFMLYLLFWIFSIQIMSVLNRSSNIVDFIKFYMYVFMPLSMLSVKISNKNMKFILPKAIKIYNLFIYTGLTFSIVDFILGGKLQFNLSLMMPNSSSFPHIIQSELAYGIYRSHGILGHSLTSALLYLTYFALNINYILSISTKSTKDTNKILLITMLGLILSNSKLGLILGFITILLNLKYIKGQINKITYIIMITFGILIFLNTAYFENNILQRFVQVVDLGDFTNGRLGAINTFLKNGGEFNLLFGKGMGNSDFELLKMNSNNFEMPFFMFLYDYGVLSTILIYIGILIYPVYIFLKNKTYGTIVLYMIVFIFVNSYNGMATGIGIFQMFVIVEILFIGMSNIIKEKSLSKEG